MLKSVSFRINEIINMLQCDTVIVVGIRHCTDEAGLITPAWGNGVFHKINNT